MPAHNFFCWFDQSESDKNKRQKMIDEVCNEKGETESPGTETDQKKQHQIESTKDYIHVRARRGQATDSHSLAERVINDIGFLIFSFG